MHSATAADAEDAFQRAMEKLLTRPPALAPGASPLPWLLTVVRNEALMICRANRNVVAVAYEDLADKWPDERQAPADRLIDREDADRGREALLRIDTDQARCLLLKADGMSYNEIAECTGFTYAKVHRALTEGRRVYRGLFNRIESGAECRRLEPTLSKFVDGELDPAESSDLQLHLNGCAACRATVRDFRDTLGAIAVLFPVSVSAVDEAGRSMARMGDAWAHFTAWINERVLVHVPSTPAAELATGKKFALAAAAAGSVVAGGIGIERAVSTERDDRPASTPISRPAVDRADSTDAATAQPEKPRAKRSAKRRKERAATDADMLQRSTDSSGSKAVTQSDRSGSPPIFDPDTSAPELDQPAGADLDGGNTATGDDLALPE